MPTEAALLAAVRAAPADDLPRLVYADWLDETDDPARRDRADFIRVQCRLAGLPERSPERRALVKREKELLKRYAKAWATPFRELVSWWAYRRGFLDTAVVGTEGMDKRFEPLFRQLVDGTPLVGICLFEQFGQPEVLLPAAPLMTGLREFGVRHGHLHEEGAAYRKLLHSPHLSGLTHLDLEGPRNGSWFRPRVLSSILQSPVLANLTTLLVSDYITDLHPTVLSAIAKSRSLANLRRLGVMSTEFDAAEMRAFARARFAGTLETLELQFCTLTPAAWDVLLSPDAFPRLNRLLLGQARVAGVEVSAKGDAARRVREQVRRRFGKGALDLRSEFPPRPWYHSWWEK